jgi:hypothetical protein
MSGFHHTISQGRRVDAFLYYTEDFWALSGIRCVWCLPTSPHSITTQNNIVTSGYVQSPILQAVTLFQLYTVDRSCTVERWDGFGWRLWKETACPVLRYCASIYLEGLRKNVNRSQDNRSPDRKSKSVLSIYKAEVRTTEPRLHLEKHCSLCMK